MKRTELNLFTVVGLGRDLQRLAQIGDGSRLMLLETRGSTLGQAAAKKAAEEKADAAARQQERRRAQQTKLRTQRTADAATAAHKAPSRLDSSSASYLPEKKSWRGQAAASRRGAQCGPRLA